MVVGNPKRKQGESLVTFLIDRSFWFYVVGTSIADIWQDCACLPFCYVLLLTWLHDLHDFIMSFTGPNSPQRWSMSYIAWLRDTIVQQCQSCCTIGIQCHFKVFTSIRLFLQNMKYGMEEWFGWERYMTRMTKQHTRPSTKPPSKKRLYHAIIPRNTINITSKNRIKTQWNFFTGCHTTHGIIFSHPLQPNLFHNGL